MKRFIAILLALAVILSVIAFAFFFFSYGESTFEFDCVNFRVRYCERTRTRLFDWVLSERCSEPEEHAVGQRLRELGVLEPVRPQAAEWILMSGFKPGVRGWRGPGRHFITALGEVSFGTAVTLPAEENLAENAWVKWASRDPIAAREFWEKFRTFAEERGKDDGYSQAWYLQAAKDYLEQNHFKVSAPELAAHAERALAE